MKDNTQQAALLQQAVYASVQWARTGHDYQTMRNAIEAYFVGCTPDSDRSLWYVHNSRRLAMHELMMKCINPLTPAELTRLNCEVRDIASDLPNNVIRGFHR